METSRTATSSWNSVSNTTKILWRRSTICTIRVLSTLQETNLSEKCINAYLKFHKFYTYINIRNDHQVPKHTYGSGLALLKS